MKLLNSKKGVVDALKPLAIGLVTFAVVLVVGFLVISESQTQICDVEGLDGGCTDNTTSVALNATISTVDAMSSIPDWLPIIVIVVIGVLLLALVKKFR